MAILFYNLFDKPDLWRNAFLEHMPKSDFRVFPDQVGNPDDIEYALVWKPKPGDMAKFKNLKAMFALGAGVDAMIHDPTLPTHIPLVRLVDPAMTRGMSEWVIYWVLHFHRDLNVYGEQRRRNVWLRHPAWLTPDRRVGIIGMGELGQDAARKLKALEFDVAGWSRTPKTIRGIECFSGKDGLAPFLKRTHILVALLPLTKETENIVNARMLAQLPEGAFFLNAARGPHVVDQDLIDALDSGHLAGAALDAFRVEPLPADHPFWRHPKIEITPHSSGPTFYQSASREIALNVKRMMRGKPPLNIVDRARGY
ncbi:MAG: glyoxylate/hydroxypyruvate reductase A [Rhodospirillales bacterium]|nr:glyoxylate/hydroxypyruvate reductase A [Rhodospirillales bacterium]